MSTRIAVVAIGRNEGARLAACLASIARSGARATAQVRVAGQRA